MDVNGCAAVGHGRCGGYMASFNAVVSQPNFSMKLQHTRAVREAVDRPVGSSAAQTPTGAAASEKRSLQSPVFTRIASYVQNEIDRAMQTIPALTRYAAKLTNRTNSGAPRTVVLGVLLCQATIVACHSNDPRRAREPLGWSAWVEDAAAQRGYIKPGDFAQFGCPPGWMGVDETAAALRGRQVSTTYMGTDPPPHEGTITCVSQREFALPAQSASAHPRADPVRRPLTPVWVSTGGDGITIGFTRELPSSAPIYIGQDTPCGPRLIGVELGDLLKWLSDPHWGPKRHFLGMISGGCPEQNRR